MTDNPAGGETRPPPDDAPDEPGKSAATVESVGFHPYDPPEASSFARHDWVLVGVLVFSFLVVPPAIIYLPSAQGLIESVGLSLRDAYLTLPMLPAILLGTTAVWAAVRSRSR